MEADAALNEAWVIGEVVAAMAEDVFEVADVAEDAIGDRLTDERPEGFDGLQFWGTRRQPVKDDVVGRDQLLGRVPAGVVHDQDDELLPVRIRMSGKVGQRRVHQLGLHPWQKDAERPAGLGFGEAIDVEPLIFHLAVAQRPRSL